jgi:hypothetical protein
MIRVPVAANGDYVLVEDTNNQVVTVAWDAIGGATVKLYGRIKHTDGTMLDFPVANGQFLATTDDGQGNDLKSINVQVNETLFAKVTGFSVAFALWVA